MYSGCEFSRCLIVEDVPIDVDDLGVFPLLMYGLICFDEAVGLA